MTDLIGVTQQDDGEWAACFSGGDNDGDVNIIAYGSSKRAALSILFQEIREDFLLYQEGLKQVDAMLVELRGQQ